LKRPPTSRWRVSLWNGALLSGEGRDAGMQIALNRVRDELDGASAVVGGINVNLPSMSAAVAQAISRAECGQGFLLFTLNLDDLVKLRSSEAYAEIYRRADLVTADGWPIAWFARRQGVRLEQTCGSDVVEPLCGAAAARRLGVYFIGPGPRAQVGAIGKIRALHPGFQLSGAEAPLLPTGLDPSILAAIDLEALAGRINASGARLCFIALGNPKQSFLADALTSRCPKVGFICVGAALDFLSGEMPRAPLWMRRNGLEWFWRFVHEPRRFFRRYFQCGLVFIELFFKIVVLRTPAARL